MHKLMILSIVALLASTSGVLAEADLQLPVDHGAVAGKAAKDTVACGMRVPADPWVGLGDECLVSGASPVPPAPVNVRAARSNPHETTPLRPAPANVTTARSNPHEITPIRPAPADEASLPVDPQ